MVASLPMRAPTKPLFARELPPGPLRDTLRPITDVRVLLPLVHLHSSERLLSVLDDELRRTREALDRMGLQTAKNILSALDGNPIRENVINQDVLG